MNHEQQDIEARLRSAITDRTSRVEPSAHALRDIEERLMEAQRDTNRKRMLVGLGSAAAIAAVVLAAVVLSGDDGEQELDVAGTTTTVEETTTTVEEPTTSTEATTSTTAFTPTVDPAAAIWPRVHTSQRFDSPEAAAQSFAVELLHFVEPVMGAFQQGDNRSGEVEVRPTASGPVTTVLLRQLEDDTWFVIAADTADITLDQPQAGTDIDCPVHLAGTALAFEGHVDVAVYADFVEGPIGTGFVTGSGSPPAGPFEGDIECDVAQLDDGIHYGTIVLSTASGEDGRIWTAEVVRVQLK